MGVVSVGFDASMQTSSQQSLGPGRTDFNNEAESDEISAPKAKCQECQLSCPLRAQSFVRNKVVQCH